jgi:hypothetical protein
LTLLFLPLFCAATSFPSFTHSHLFSKVLEDRRHVADHARAKHHTPLGRNVRGPEAPLAFAHFLEGQAQVHRPRTLGSGAHQKNIRPPGAETGFIHHEAAPLHGN